MEANLQPQSLKLTIKLKRNKSVGDSSTTAYRLNNAEGDCNPSDSSGPLGTPNTYPEEQTDFSSAEEGENHGTVNEGDQTSESSQYQLVLYDPAVNGANNTENAPDPASFLPPSGRPHPFADRTRRVLPSVGAFTVQCANCFKWRLIPTKEKYEEIREHIMAQPFVCETAREWRPNVSCDDDPDITQDGSRLWAIDKPNIAQPPPGWQRLLRIRGEGGTRFADVCLDCGHMASISGLHFSRLSRKIQYEGYQVYWHMTRFILSALDSPESKAEEDYLSHVPYPNSLAASLILYVGFGFLRSLLKPQIIAYWNKSCVGILKSCCNPFVHYLSWYYVAPSGKVLRSGLEIQRYLEKHPEYMNEEVSLSRFSFQTPKPLQEDYVRKRPTRPALQDYAGNHGIQQYLPPPEVARLTWESTDVDTDLQLSSPALANDHLEAPASNLESRSAKRRIPSPWRYNDELA